MIKIREVFGAMCVALTMVASDTVEAVAQAAKWSIDPTPAFILGRAGDGSTAEFAFASGATMLSDGNVMVTDRGDYSMYIVAPTGKVVKKFARKGEGPGELTNAFFSWRCGNRVFRDGDRHGDRHGDRDGVRHRNRLALLA